MTKKFITIPIFPLNSVFLPGENKLLHIFEDRYKELLKDCVENGAHFGVVYLKGEKIAEYGVTVKIIRVFKTSIEGETDIMVQALDTFKIHAYKPVLFPKLYGAANVEKLQQSIITTDKTLFEAAKKYFRYFKNRKLQKDLDLGVSIFKIASMLDLTNEEKLQLIAIETIKKKEEFINGKILLFIHLLATENKLAGEFWLN